MQEEEQEETQEEEQPAEPEQEIDEETEDSPEQGSDQDEATTGSTEADRGLSFDNKEGVVVISDVGRTEETVFRTEKGDIHVIHEIALGDVVVSMLLASILLVFFLDRVIRR